MRERESFLRRLEERLSRVSGWLAERRRGGQASAGDLHGRTESVRRDISRALHSVAQEDLARVRASLEAMRADYDVPPPHFALRRPELDAFRRYLETTARLEPVLSNLDAPSWEKAHEEYERAWGEVERAFEQQGDAASP